MIDYVGNNTSRAAAKRNWLKPLISAVVFGWFATLVYWGAGLV